MGNMTIREFIKRFDNGDFNSSDVHTQCEAGWYDWFCKDSSLKNKTIALTKKLKTLLKSDKIDQDNMYVFFKNNCPMVGPLRDDFRICDIKTGKVIYTITPTHKIPDGTEYHGYKRVQKFKTQSDVWGKENDFDKPLVEGSWNDVKAFFGV